MSPDLLSKYLSDAIPAGDHPSPHAEWIPVRLDVVQAAIDHIDSAIDRIDWFERGLIEWRSIAMHNAKTAEAARATARIAISHLTASISGLETAKESAREWLASIGFVE